MELNLKMSTILFVLRDIRYKECVKGAKFEIQSLALIASSSEPSIATSNSSFSSYFDAIFCASESEILGALSSAW